LQEFTFVDKGGDKMKIICIKAPKLLKNIFMIFFGKENKKTVEKKTIR
jgi:hypothetical protein